MKSRVNTLKFMLYRNIDRILIKNHELVYWIIFPLSFSQTYLIICRYNHPAKSRKIPKPILDCRKTGMFSGLWRKKSLLTGFKTMLKCLAYKLLIELPFFSPPNFIFPANTFWLPNLPNKYYTMNQLFVTHYATMFDIDQM